MMPLPVIVRHFLWMRIESCTPSAYARYIDKTQVFYLIPNDHITHRVLHVQLVSKIARTIGRFLKLNEDLIEAVALAMISVTPPLAMKAKRIYPNYVSRPALGISCIMYRVFNFSIGLSAKDRDGTYACRPWMVSCVMTVKSIIGC